MKLLITTDDFLPRWDGISRFLNELIPRIKGCEITIIAPDFGIVRAKDYELIQIPLQKRSISDYTPAKYKKKLVDKYVQEADVIFNQALGPIGLAAILSAKKRNKPLLTYVHSIEWELTPRIIKNHFLRRIAYYFSRSYARRLYNKCTALIVPSEQIADYLTRNKIFAQKKIAYLGVDTKKFVQQTPSNKRQARKQLDLPRDAYIIGYHGRLAPEKNLQTLIRAFIRTTIPDKKLLIVGDGLPEIKEKLRREGVILAGKQDDVVPYLQAMDCYVLPSYTETTSLSVLEAMSCGLPVISSKVGYVNFYIKNKENGFFFNMFDAHDLSKKLRQVYALSHEERLKVTLNARKTVEEQFRWDDTAKKILGYLNECLQEQETNKQQISDK